MSFLSNLFEYGEKCHPKKKDKKNWIEEYIGGFLLHEKRKKCYIFCAIHETKLGKNWPQIVFTTYHISCSYNCLSVAEQEIEHFLLKYYSYLPSASSDRSNSEYLVRNTVQTALPSYSTQKAKTNYEYFWLGRTLRPEAYRNWF